MTNRERLRDRLTCHSPNREIPVLGSVLLGILDALDAAEARVAELEREVERLRRENASLRKSLVTDFSFGSADDED